MALPKDALEVHVLLEGIRVICFGKGEFGGEGGNARGKVRVSIAFGYGGGKEG